jgi:hypothetical protein
MTWPGSAHEVPSSRVGSAVFVATAHGTAFRSPSVGHQVPSPVRGCRVLHETKQVHPAASSQPGCLRRLPPRDLPGPREGPRAESGVRPAVTVRLRRGHAALLQRSGPPRLPRRADAEGPTSADCPAQRPSSLSHRCPLLRAACKKGRVRRVLLAGTLPGAETPRGRARTTGSDVHSAGACGAFSLRVPSCCYAWHVSAAEVAVFAGAGDRAWSLPLIVD